MSKLMISPSYGEFEFWFLQTGNYEAGRCKFLVICKETNTVVGEIKDGEEPDLQCLVKDGDENPDVSMNIVDENSDTIFANFERFKERPEYQITVAIPKVTAQSGLLEDIKFAYFKVITGVCLTRYIRNSFKDNGEPLNSPDNAVLPGLAHMLDWLDNTKFYEGPASTQYHGSYRCGLVEHSLDVCRVAQKLIHLFPNIQIDSVLLVAAVHDWCKILKYETYLRNVKNDKGAWEQVPCFRRTDSLAPFGHGVESMFLAQKFFKLTTEEALAIRWHMGRWNVSREEMNEFQQACEKYPLVHLLQFADMLSITAYKDNL